MHQKDNGTTHFGYRDVPVNEKQSLVADVFHSVSGNYDLMNDAMSFGLHRWWKIITVQLARAKKNQRVLDIAAGTCDLSHKLAEQVKPSGYVVALDINDSMLKVGRDKLTDAGIFEHVSFTQGNAESLPFADNHFDIITIGFGLRNVTNQQAALNEMYRLLKPGGQCLILEFSKVFVPILKQGYDAYSFNIIPKLGKLLANDEESYQYLVESIRKHPCQETLKNMMYTAGFDQVKVRNFLGGVVALHRGFKY